MNESDYPALFQAADKASIDAQRAHLLTVGGIGLAGIAGMVLTLYLGTSRPAIIVAAGLFFASLALNALGALRNYEAVWYRARAVAESIKTMSWRFMMRSEPYDTLDVQSATSSFLRRLHSILSEHTDLAVALAPVPGGSDQITSAMCRIRDLPLGDRIDFYRQDRIEEQRAWYARKAVVNKSNGQRWFWVMVVLQSGAVVCTLLRIAAPSWQLIPTDVFIVAAVSVLGWTQVKRFRELAAAYSLAAHEIGLARAGVTQVTDDQQFANFVADTENAFSREHTQWAARRL